MTNTSKFDKNIKTLIGGFLELQDECYHQENFFLGEAFFNTNKNKFNFIYYKSFYSLFRDICSVPLYFLINEEISNAHGRDLFPDLLHEIINEGYYTAKRKHLSNNENIDSQHTYEELSYLLINNFNELFGSQMLDFKISSYSAFENWMSRLYDSLCPNHHKEIESKRKSEIRNIITNYITTPSEPELDKTTADLLKMKGGFISFPDRVNEIYKKIDKSLYKRTINTDKEIILFIGKMRNTVHSNGIHNGKDASININNRTHTLEKGKPYKSASWVDSLNLTRELILIYTEILKSIPARCDIVESFIIGDINNQSFNIFLQICNDFINSHAVEDKNIETLAAFSTTLEVKMKIKSRTINNIIKALKSKTYPFSGPHDFLIFLSQDFTKI